MLRIGINGFGRIGRSFARVLARGYNPDLQIVAINDPMDIESLIHLLKYDSVHGRFPWPVEKCDGGILLNGQFIRVTHYKSIKDIGWSTNKVDVVLESTGLFKTKVELQEHLNPGVKAVVLSAPTDDPEIPTVVIGINDHQFKQWPALVSNASCTTNNAAPMIKVISELVGIEHAYITTVHSFTTDQRLHDAPHKDLRRARAATLSMVPTTTGAAKALGKVFPELDGKIGGCGIRVPVPDGSLTDITFTVQRQTTVEEVNRAFFEASQGEMKGVLGYTNDPIVSADVLGIHESCLFDEQLTSVLGKMVKVVGWYDNEMSYSHRLADLIAKYEGN